MWQAGMLLNSENANMTLERPLYLLTLEDKVEWEVEKLTFLFLQGGKRGMVFKEQSPPGLVVRPACVPPSLTRGWR